MSEAKELSRAWKHIALQSLFRPMRAAGQYHRCADPGFLMGRIHPGNPAPTADVCPAVAPEYPCPHPYFSEDAMAFAVMGQFLALGLFVLAVLAWIGTRWLALAGAVVAMGVLTLLACYAALRWGDELIMRGAFGADNWSRLQRELRAREADLVQYSRENPGLTTSQIVKGYIATHRRLPGFHFADPNIPPLYFKISDWRDTIPRVVVSFGCDNNVVFNSATMVVEQVD